MEYILALLLVPTIWIISSKFIFKHNISNKEIGIQFGLTFLLVFVGYFISKANLTSDYELINGQITGKEQISVSCSHSYDCNCKYVTRYRTVTRNGRSRSESYRKRICDTCYEHKRDYDWKIYSNVGNFTISRIDRQGIYTPPRWEHTLINEPASVIHSTENYIKGNKLSLFNQDKKLEDLYKNSIPKYPEIYDIYRVKRVLSVGIIVPNIDKMNLLLNEQMRILGPQKQANVILIITSILNQNYRYALEKAWIGGKKNDIIVIIGVDHDLKINWVDSITLGKNAGNELFQVRMRDELTSLQTINNPDTIIMALSSVVTNDFKRKSMKDFKYLENEIQPSITALIILFILTLLANIGLTYYFYHQEI